MQPNRIAVGIGLAVLVALASIALAVQISTYFVSITPTIVRSPVEFENGADGTGTIDHVNKTRATIHVTIFPLATWVSEDALRIHNVNDTLVKIRLRCASVDNFYGLTKYMKVYLVINAIEYLALEFGENGVIVKGQSDWYTMAADAIYQIKVVAEGKSGIIEGTKATIVIRLDIAPAS